MHQQLPKREENNPIPGTTKTTSNSWEKWNQQPKTWKEKHRPFCYAFTFFSFPHVLGAAGVFPVSFIHDFGCWLHSFHGWEVVFVVLGTGLFSPRFWAAGAFSIHVSCEFMCFYHGWEEPFTFLTVSATFGPHALAIWDVFPCCELVSLISFRTVCFPSCCEPFLLLCMGLCNLFLLFKLC